MNTAANICTEEALSAIARHRLVEAQKYEDAAREAALATRENIERMIPELARLRRQVSSRLSRRLDREGTFKEAGKTWSKRGQSTRTSGGAASGSSTDDDSGIELEL